MSLSVFPGLNVLKARTVLLLLPFLISCASYRTKLSDYYSNIGRENYAAALEAKKANLFLSQDRNKLLYYMERGKLFHLMQSYDSSNLYFNKADEFLESKRKTAGDFIVSNLLNPMTQTYLGEDFERFMIHYYKALNYLYLNDPEGARVEARRITLSTSEQEDKFRVGSDRYKQDAFAFMVQGMIYELNGETNNAFISYRNAVDLFLSNQSHTYYGVHLPGQLIRDLYKTAFAMGFTEQIDIYASKTGIPFEQKPVAEGGELILFFEKGMAPVKVDQSITVTNDGINGFFFDGPYGRTGVPFNYAAAGWVKPRPLNEFRMLRVAIPGYEPRQYRVDPFTIQANGESYTGELAQEFNVLAKQVLEERMVKEIAEALVRAVVKKTSEYAVSEAAKAVAKSSDKKDEKKKQRDGEAAALTAGLLMNIFNSATEKADTRNWQSLPAFIQYVRVPLKKGNNQIVLGSTTGEKTVSINGSGGIQLMNWCIMH
ncbi:MAG: hypothetical protein I8H66_00800 [Sphingobacteriia bacterium]|nr:hypothetical protein [Sphingobacteriia bacterium]